MDGNLETKLRDNLVDRRQRLRAAVGEYGPEPDLNRLLELVDDAITRMDAGSYGACDVCCEKIDDRDLLANPFIRYCLCALSESQQRALEADIQLARRIQAGLLPQQDLRSVGWEVHYRYEPLGPVSGDYCDLLTRRNHASELIYLVGDVSGKGLAASLLMSHLNASFRSLLDMGLTVREMVERANRLFLERSADSAYATLVCGRATDTGAIEICNAGHCAPLLVRNGAAEPIESGGFPIGMMQGKSYLVRSDCLARGDLLVLYTDGLTEARDRAGGEYGMERLGRKLTELRARPLRAIADALLADLAAFQGGTPREDDLSLMILRRAA